MNPLRILLAAWEARSRNALPADAMLINRHIRELREALAANAIQGQHRTVWADAAIEVPTEADGEVFVRFTDGSFGTAWATYWHGASSAFASWTLPDPEDKRTVAQWLKALQP